MKVSTLCSGIGAPEVAAKRLGWECLWAAEIEPFPSAVLSHHHPESVNHGDLTKLHGANLEKPDVLVFGSPCQSFSVAGKRVGLDDPRGNITLECLRIVGELLPEWIVWENVPGVLSIDGGRTFGTILGIVGKLGYGFAYRILDAQFFGVPQRRRRVFLVGHLGGWRSAAAVLFERESLRGDSSPSREKGERTSSTTAPSLTGSGRGVERIGESRGQDPVIACPLTSNPYGDHESREGLLIAHSLTSRYDSSEYGCGRGIPLVMAHGQGNAEVAEGVGTMLNCNHEAPIVFRKSRRTAMSVRRLTPRECCRLQGFPDDYTLIQYKGKPAADGPRYKALGNSMAVPVMEYILKAIKEVSK
jgi:DNA (cytosine-5)-methyltransferase 1